MCLLCLHAKGVIFMSQSSRPIYIRIDLREKAQCQQIAYLISCFGEGNLTEGILGDRLPFFYSFFGEKHRIICSFFI